MKTRVYKPELHCLENRDLLSTVKPLPIVRVDSPTSVVVFWNPVKASTGTLVQEDITKFTKVARNRSHSTTVTTAVTIAKLGPGVTSFTVNGLQPSSSHTFNLVNLHGKVQTKSVLKSVTTPAWSPPPAPHFVVGPGYDGNGYGTGYHIVACPQSPSGPSSYYGVVSYNVYVNGGFMTTVSEDVTTNIATPFVTKVAPGATFNVLATGSGGSTWGVPQYVGYYPVG